MGPKQPELTPAIVLRATHDHELGQVSRPSHFFMAEPSEPAFVGRHSSVETYHFSLSCIAGIQARWAGTRSPRVTFVAKPGRKNTQYRQTQHTGLILHTKGNPRRCMSDSQKRHQGRNILWGEARLSWLAMHGWPWAVGRPSTRPTAEPLRSLKTVILRAQQRPMFPA